MVTVSVIIPLYNAEDTIAAAIQSVRRQTYPDLELIVVDDGSTDSSLATAQGIDEPRLRVYSFGNAGASAARNRGIAHAKGAFIAFLDADDLWSPDKLADQVKALEEHPQAALAYSWCDYINAAGQVVCSGKRSIAGADTYAKLLVANFLENGSTPLIRRQALEQVGYFDESLQGCQDLDLYLRLARQYRFVTVPKVQVYYRLSDGSITSNIRRQEQQVLQVLNRAYALSPPSLQLLKPKSLAHLYRFLMLRGVEGAISPDQSWEILRCLTLAVRYDPSLLLHQTRLLLSVLVKVIAANLPAPATRRIMALSRRYRTAGNT